MVDKLSGMPPEITHEIIKALDPLDVSAVSKTCRSLNRFISEDSLLFRDIYINLLDEPTDPFIPSGWNWLEQLIKFVKFRRALGDSIHSRSVAAKAQRLEHVDPFLSELMTTAKPGKDSKNIAILNHYFDTSRPNNDGRWNQEAFLCRSLMFQRAACKETLQPHVHPPTTALERQRSAKMHCLYGVPIESPFRTHYNHAYPYAVSIVYDLRRYTDSTLWGPFQEDGEATVDWEKMEAIMVVLGHNLRLFVERTRNAFRNVWKDPWIGASPDSFRSESVTGLRQPAPPVEALDPYNVTGSWMRKADFHDLFAYNFAPPELPDTQPRPPLDITEAIRLIIMEIKVTKICPSEDGSEYPVVHFSGVSRSMHTSFDPNANANIRGMVRMTKEGEVRWTSYSVYSGQERWKSEGIQVGGIRSQRGVFGHWFDKDHDDHGPAGPTAFWKVSNEIDERKGRGWATDDSDSEDDPDYDEGDVGDSDEEANVIGFILGAAHVHLFGIGQ